MKSGNTVIVLSAEGKFLNPCHPARARELLRRARARVVKTMPFTIQLLRAFPIQQERGTAHG